MNRFSYSGDCNTIIALLTLLYIGILPLPTFRNLFLTANPSINNIKTFQIITQVSYLPHIPPVYLLIESGPIKFYQELFWYWALSDPFQFQLLNPTLKSTTHHIIISMSDYEEEYEHEYEYQEEPEEEPELNYEQELDDALYSANDLLKNNNFAEAKEQFKQIIEGAKETNLKSFQLKGMCGLFLIQCKQNSPQAVKELKEILEVVNGVSKKEKEEAIKSLVDNIIVLTNRDLYYQSKQILFENLNQVEESVKIKGLLRLGQLYNQDKDSKFFDKCLHQLRTQINQSQAKNERIIENKLEIYCLEIQYLQDKTGGKDPRIQEIAKETSKMKMEITDSSISATIKENIGRMLVHEKNYEKAALELMEAFKDYVRIGDPKAKNVLKHAALVGILARDEINPFVHQESKVYADHEDMQIVQNIRKSFQQKDMKLFNKNISSPLILEDSFSQSLAQELKQVVTIQKLKVLTKPYNRITFSYLGLILGTTSSNIERYLFKLITEGDIEGRIDTKNGYFEKKKQVNNLLKDEQQLIDMLLSSLPRFYVY